MLYVDIRLGWFRAANRVESIDCPSAFFMLVLFFTKLLKWFSLFADGLSRIKLIFIIHLVEPEQQMQTETNSDQPRPLLRLGHLHNCHKPGKINCIYQTTIVVQLQNEGRDGKGGAKVATAALLSGHAPSPGCTQQLFSQVFAVFVPRVHKYFPILHFRYKFWNLWCVSLARHVLHALSAGLHSTLDKTSPSKVTLLPDTP